MSSDICQSSEVTVRRKVQPGVMLHSPDGHLRRLRDIEADIICLAISRYQGNMTEIARNLNIGRSTLYRKFDELQIACNP
jgi:DNA-binding NtrC family response regulator